MEIQKSRLPKWINNINNPTNQMIEGFNKQMKEISEGINKIQKYETERQAQPFIANDLNRKLIKKQTPTWINYLILIISFLILLLTIYDLFLR